MCIVTLLVLSYVASAQTTDPDDPNGSIIIIGTDGPFAICPEISATFESLHNDLRASIARGDEEPSHPQATNMNELLWDPALANMAANAVLNCDSIGTDDSLGTSVGEVSIEISKFDTNTQSCSDINGILGRDLSQYIDELKDKFVYEKVTTSTSGYYTQMIWANTRYIGCAASICGQLTCLYYSVGNVIGKYPYKKGKTCTQCARDRKCDKNGLCAPLVQVDNFIVIPLDPHTLNIIVWSFIVGIIIIIAISVAYCCKKRNGINVIKVTKISDVESSEYSDSDEI